MPARVRLNHHTVAAMACPPGRKDALVFDSEMPGFGLRVTEGGAKLFVVQYTSAAGRRRMTIGRFGVVTADEARRKARVMLGAVAANGDPFGERQAERAAVRQARAEADLRSQADAYTFGKLAEGWKAALTGERSQGYLRPAFGQMKKHLVDWWDRPAEAITTREAARLLDAVKAGSGPIAANRVLGYARAAYGWAVKRQLVENHPLRGLEAPSRERPRDRVLSAAEIGEIWRAAADLVAPGPAFIRILLLTLQRREEVAGMTWTELAPDLSTWTIPKERAKNGRSHQVHLSEPARELLRGQARIEGCAFVFPGERARPVEDRRATTTFSTIKVKLDAAIAAERAKHSQQPAAPPPWVLHDFRRTGVTTLAELGHPPHVADKLLNHVTGAIQGVAAVYQRAQFLPERRKALDAWAAHVAKASGLTPQPAMGTPRRKAVSAARVSA